MDGMMPAPLIITREGLQTIGEGIVQSSNERPHVNFIDAFLEMKECGWCRRRWGVNNLQRGICPECRTSIRGRSVIARMVCKTCAGGN
jgi:hypothetical protein